MLDWNCLEAAVRRDPAGRGLASFCDADGRRLCGGALEAAARDLAANGKNVLVVTGFAVMTDAGVTAETDGPPGAIYLAAMLRTAGIATSIATDRYGAPLVRAGLQATKLPATLLVENPQSSYSHLVAVERVGPSHTAATAQSPEFERLVPQQDRDVCHNMRGESIDAMTEPLHRLFENSAAATIGIVDGGNEIGCGSIAWNVLRRAIPNGPTERTACRIATTYTIPCGVSNWGTYALGAAVAALRGHREAVEAWTAETQRALIETMVRDGGAVDGMTRRREPTVDGLPLDDYLSTFDEIRSIALGSV